MTRVGRCGYLQATYGTLLSHARLHLDGIGQCVDTPDNYAIRRCPSSVLNCFEAERSNDVRIVVAPAVDTPPLVGFHDQVAATLATTLKFPRHCFCPLVEC